MWDFLTHGDPEETSVKFSIILETLVHLKDLLTGTKSFGIVD